LVLTAALLASANYAELFHHTLLHVGVALIIAAVVGLFLEIAEIQAFFETRLVRILGSDGFVGLLSEQKSLDLSVAAAKGLGRLRTNNPAYEYEDFARTIGQDVLNLIGKPYRRDLAESIFVQWLNPEQAAAIDVAHKTGGGSLARIKQGTAFTLISPTIDKDYKYEYKFLVYFDNATGIDCRKHTSFEFKIDGKSLPVNCHDFFKDVDGSTSWEFRYEMTFRESCFIEAHLSTVEYMAETYASNMVHLTKNATIHFSSNDPLDLQAQISGIAGKGAEPSISKNSVAIKFDGWVLPGHGYSINWTWR